MGWCHEFGVDIVDGCDHPMMAYDDSCRCEVCGVVCEGRFKGCTQVWERGPVEIEIVRSRPSGRRAPRASHAVAEPELSVDALPAPPNGNGRVSDALAWAAYRSHESSHGSGPAPEGASLGAAVDRLRRRLRELEMTMGSSGRRQISEQVARLTNELPRRVGSAIASAVETGQDADLRYLEELEALVVATISTVRSRTAALVADDHPISP